MPEMIFVVRWPDGTLESCYSPSLVVKDFLSPGRSYPLDEFVGRSTTALGIASDRIKAKYGRYCSRAAAQRARIETAAAFFAGVSDASVTVETFEE